MLICNGVNMNLIPSICVTALITAAIWLLLVLQPQSGQVSLASTQAQKQAQTIRQTPPSNRQVTEAAATMPNQQPSMLDWPHDIKGITATLELTNINDLWAQFMPQLNAVTQNPGVILVYYRNFNSVFTQATVTIGVAESLLKTNTSAIALPATRHYQTVLDKQPRSDAELTEGWNLIDYHRGVLSVLEVHYLDAFYNPSASELLVQYQ